MANPDSPSAQKTLGEYFIKNTQPIWPNLTHKQTGFEFRARREWLRHSIRPLLLEALKTPNWKRRPWVTGRYAK